MDDKLWEWALPFFNDLQNAALNNSEMRKWVDRPKLNIAPKIILYFLCAYSIFQTGIPLASLLANMLWLVTQKVRYAVYLTLVVRSKEDCLLHNK